jgi:hypothetical protein
MMPEAAYKALRRKSRAGSYFLVDEKIQLSVTSCIL